VLSGHPYAKSWTVRFCGDPDDGPAEQVGEGDPPSPQFSEALPVTLAVTLEPDAVPDIAPEMFALAVQEMLGCVHCSEPCPCTAPAICVPLMLASVPLTLTVPVQAAPDWLHVTVACPVMVPPPPDGFCVGVAVKVPVHPRPLIGVTIPPDGMVMGPVEGNVMMAGEVVGEAATDGIAIGVGVASLLGVGVMLIGGTPPLLPLPLPLPPHPDDTTVKIIASKKYVERLIPIPPNCSFGLMEMI
jgi:hypothetical protein